MYTQVRKPRGLYKLISEPRFAAVALSFSADSRSQTVPARRTKARRRDKPEPALALEQARKVDTAQIIILPTHNVQSARQAGGLPNPRGESGRRQMGDVGQGRPEEQRL